jgi:hypothetical protein
LNRINLNYEEIKWVFVELGNKSLNYLEEFNPSIQYIHPSYSNVCFMQAEGSVVFRETHPSHRYQIEGNAKSGGK